MQIHIQSIQWRTSQDNGEDQSSPGTSSHNTSFWIRNQKCLQKWINKAAQSSTMCNSFLGLLHANVKESIVLHTKREPIHHHHTHRRLSPCRNRTHSTTFENDLRRQSMVHALNEHGHIPIYLAARSGFYDLTIELLKAGSTIDHQQQHGSMALRAACYFEIVKLLLEHGASYSIKNMWNHTPVNEADNEEMIKILKQYSEDTVSKMQETLMVKLPGTVMCQWNK